MKKFLTLAVATVLILGLAVATYAIEITTSGDIRSRSGMTLNARGADLKATATGLAPGFDETASWVQQRVRFRWAIAANDYLTGYFRLEGKEDDWGGDAGLAKFGTDDPDALVVQHAFIAFKVPGLEDYGAELDVGAQSFFLGRWSFDGDSAGITADFKVEPASIRLIWIKEEEGLDHTSEDYDDYGAIIRVPFGDISPAVWFFWSHVGHGAETVSLGGPNSSSNLWWLGFTVDGKIGPVSFLGDFAYNGGSLDYSAPVGTVDEDEFGGYLFYAKGSMPVGDMYEVGAEFLYATGDDSTDATTKGEFDGYKHTNKNMSHASLLVFTENNVNGGVGISGGLASGYWSAMGYASAKPLDWLKVTGYAAYIADTTDDGDTFGTAETAGVADDNDDIGFEVGAIANIQIYKELALNVGAGMLFPGDALEQHDAATGTNEDPDDPWAITSLLIYSF